MFGLAVVSLIGGSRLLDIKQFITQAVIETENYCNAVRDPATPPFAFPSFSEQANDSVPSGEETGERLFNRYATWPFGVGIVLGFAFYCRRSPMKTT